MTKLNKTQLAKAMKDLKVLNGDPPFDNWSNICYGDGYFANSLVKRYGMPLDELGKVCGYEKWSKAYRKAKAALDKKFA